MIQNLQVFCLFYELADVMVTERFWVTSVDSVTSVTEATCLQVHSD